LIFSRVSVGRWTERRGSCTTRADAHRSTKKLPPLSSPSRGMLLVLVFLAGGRKRAIGMKARTSFLSFSCNTSRMFRPKCRASRMMFLSRLMWKNISPRTARANALLRTPFALQLPLAKGCLGFRVMISTRHAPSPQHATVRKPLRLTSIPTRRRQREGDTTTLLLFARSRRETDGSPFQAGCSLTLTEGNEAEVLKAMHPLSKSLSKTPSPISSPRLARR